MPKFEQTSEKKTDKNAEISVERILSSNTLIILIAERYFLGARTELTELKRKMPVFHYDCQIEKVQNFLKVFDKHPDPPVICRRNLDKTLKRGVAAAVMKGAAGGRGDALDPIDKVQLNYTRKDTLEFHLVV